MVATLENIVIGSKIKAGSMVMEITEETKTVFKGHQFYKNKKYECLILKSSFSNPHYMNKYQLINNK
jgi:hypothetical protein